MLRTIIVEDEIDAQTLLAKILLEYCNDIELLGIAASVSAAKQLIERENPDLIFLDIQLEDGSGFELLDILSELSAKIIFTTAYDNYALRAFKYEAVDYILKPYSPQDIINGLERVRKISFNKELYLKLGKILHPDNKDKISINTNEGILFIDIIDIIRLEADRSYCTVFLVSDKKILVSKPMGELEKRLPRDQFIKVHLSHIVNEKWIKRFVKEEGGYILMKDKSRVPVSRRRKADVMKLLE